jgi:uncharacterized membrane protein
MSLLILGLVLFFGTHAISIVAPFWRDRVVVMFGAARWRVFYSLFSLLGLLLIIKGFALARQSPIVLYVPQLWMHRLAALMLVPIFPLLLATYLPGRISTATKHPTLVAVKIWALAHLLANGMLADLLLFGGFLAWAVAVRISLKRRPSRSVTSLEPLPVHDWLATAIGLAIYGGVVVWAHQRFIGVSPLS